MGTTETNPQQSRGPGIRQMIVLVVVLLAAIVATRLISDVTKVSEPGIRIDNNVPFLPPVAGPWVGSEQTGLTKEERDVLPSDTEGARRVYKDARGNLVYCSVVLAGRDVTSIHRPEVCLTGQGWKLQPARTERIRVAGAADTLSISRMNAENTFPLKNGQTAKVYSVFVYWFVGKHRTTPHHWQRILWTMQDRVFQNRNHRWAYFLINAVVPPEQAGTNAAAGQEEAMRQLRSFIENVYPQLTAGVNDHG